MENLLIYLFLSILFGLLILGVFIIYTSFNIQFAERRHNVPAFKNPSPPPCKPSNKTHDWRPNGFDIDYEYYKCKNCGVEKQIKNYL